MSLCKQEEIYFMLQEKITDQQLLYELIQSIKDLDKRIKSATDRYHQVELMMTKRQLEYTLFDLRPNWRR